MSAPQDSPNMKRDRVKILIYGLNFAPELTGVGKYTGEMASWLAASGHDVRVVTAPPYYPNWKIDPSSRHRLFRHDRVEGISVWRAPLYVPSQPRGMNRVAHLLSFALSSLPLLARQLAWRPDVVWVPQPTLFCAPAALMFSRLSGAKSWLHIQDFEVNAGFGLGLLRGSRLRSAVLKTERWLLRRFDRVSTISHRMMSVAQKKGLAHRVRLFPNWVDTNAIYPMAETSSYREHLGIKPDKIVLLYSGNMGAKQGLSMLQDVAMRLKDRSNLVFVFCGNGSYRAELESMCGDLSTVRFIDLQPPEQLNDLLSLADIHLLPQRADASDLMLPSKLTGILASGRPLIATAIVGSSLADAVRDCGLVVPPDDADAMVRAIDRLAMDPELRRRLGEAGRERAESTLSLEVILRGFEASLLQLCLGRDPEDSWRPMREAGRSQASSVRATREIAGNPPDSTAQGSSGRESVKDDDKVASWPQYR